MRTTLIILGLAGLAMTPACKKEKKKAEETPAAEPATPAPPAEGGGAAAATAPSEGAGKAASDAPTMANKMAHCPSTVPGADTAVAETKDAVVITVTAKEKARVAEIQKRAEHLDSVAAAPDTEVKHTGMGTGGGGSGKCPVVMKDVTLKIEKQKDGVKVTLTPKDPARAGELAQMAKDRVAALKEMDEGRMEDDEEPGEDEEPADEE